MIVRPKQPILIVEDSPEDFEATLRAFKKAGLKNPIYRCEDGDEALDFVHRRGVYADPRRAPRPGMILLDLNLPGTDGREFLAEIKKEPDLKTIPVVVLTTSKDQGDIDACYSAGANSFIRKPVEFKDLMEAIRRLKDYWFEVVVFPKGE